MRRSDNLFSGRGIERLGKVTSNTQAITPIFIFSLPRSGSTLTQRLLATHPEVSTASEPWILLPFFYMRIRGGVYAEYAHRIAFKAIEDFCAGLPGGPSDFLQEIREVTLRLYRARSRPDAKYFVDKTPRYHVISREIVKLFPEAKFVFLWRNPLAVISSMIETWGAGRWNIYEFEFDLFDGLEGLISGQRHAGPRACSLQFEDVVGEESEARERLFEKLGFEFDATRTGQFSTVQLTGRMGDHTGRGRYVNLSQEPLERWKHTLGSPIRKMWCRRYLRWIGKERLAVMGYDLDSLMQELDSIPARISAIPSDILRMAFGLLVRTFEPWIVRDKLTRLGRGARLHAYS